MYHYIEDKEFLKNMRRLCSDLVNRLVNNINNGNIMEVEAQLVGSGARNLEMQNEKEPIDLDYNLNILSLTKEWNWTKDARKIKEYVRKEFNIALKSIGWSDCKDSKSVLTTEKRHFTKGNKTDFSIDLAIVTEKNKKWYRLIHKKTGVVDNDEYYWNEAPNSHQLYDKVKWLKDNNCWNEVREAYRKKKNMYLIRNDYNHPSFICYVEAVNEEYNKY